ncbi:MAG: hypothetical protein JJE30_16950 [Desulfuromonadales bacterium]|nr:hypothetical protein [Desulfuromonadales bacterium]
MPLIRIVAGIAVLFCMYSPAHAAMYVLQNPAAKISNPADKMYNPATKVDNPVSGIYTPSAGMNNPKPVSSPPQRESQPSKTEVKAAAVPEIQIKKQPLLKPKPVIPQKNYTYKTTGAYITAAKKSFAQDDYVEFLSIIEDALRRINAGTLKASVKTKQKLVKFKATGYKLLNDREGLLSEIETDK